MMIVPLGPQAWGNTPPLIDLGGVFGIFLMRGELFYPITQIGSKISVDL